MKWQTKTGEVIDIEDMSNQHLLNSHRLVSEKCKVLDSTISSAWSFSCSLQGEMALDQIDSDIQQLDDMIYHMYRVKAHLKKELDRRGLTPLPIRERSK